MAVVCINMVLLTWTLKVIMLAEPRDGANLQTPKTNFKQCPACTYQSSRSLTTSKAIYFAWSNALAPTMTSVIRKRVTNRKVRSSLEATNVISMRIRPVHQNWGGFTGQFHGPQTLHFGIHLFHRSETSSQQNHHLFQHQCALKENFEEGEFTSSPSEITENKLLDARPDAFYGTRLMPEFQVELASGLIRFSRLKIRSSQCTFSSSGIDSS